MELLDRTPGPDGQLFKRQTIIDAAYVLSVLGQDALDKLKLEVGLEISDTRTSADAGANALAKEVLRNPGYQTPDGVRLDIAVVLRAAQIFESSDDFYHQALARNKVPGFRSQLEAEGILLSEQAPEVRTDSFGTPVEGGYGTGAYGSGPYGGNTFDGPRRPPAPGLGFDGQPFDSTPYDDGRTFDQYPFPESGSPAFAHEGPQADKEDIAAQTPQGGFGSFGAPFGGPAPTAGTAIGVATAGGSGKLINWNEVAPPILARLDEIDAALRELIPLARQITELKGAGHGGFGHNNPPPEQMLTASDLEEAQAATALLRQELQNPDQASSLGLRLGAKVLKRVGDIANWISDLGKLAFEEYVKALAQQAGKRTADIIFYITLAGVLGGAAAATYQALQAIPI